MSYIIEACDPDRITAVDLSAELRDAIASGSAVETYCVVEIGEDGYRKSVTGSMLWYPDHRRAGIEFGSDAQWTDASDPEDALRRWAEDEMAG